MDAAEYIRSGIEKVCVCMSRGSGSYMTASGIRFTLESPFQMMEMVDANALIADLPQRFRLATKAEVVEYYSSTKKTGPKRMQMV